jgi:hypothetical protein
MDPNHLLLNAAVEDLAAVLVIELNRRGQLLRREVLQDRLLRDLALQGDGTTGLTCRISGGLLS